MLDSGEIQTYCFASYVWGINVFPYVSLMVIKNVFSKNPANTSKIASNVIDYNRYVDNMLLACGQLSDFETIGSESRILFASRGFALRKWIAKNHGSSILQNIPKSDLAKDIIEIHFGSQPLLDAKVFNLFWDPESDRLRIK